MTIGDLKVSSRSDSHELSGHGWKLHRRLPTGLQLILVLDNCHHSTHLKNVVGPPLSVASLCEESRMQTEIETQSQLHDLGPASSLQDAASYDLIAIFVMSKIASRAWTTFS